MPNDQAPPENPVSASGEELRFDARRGPLFRLLLANAFLTLITLGVYRFWAKTKVRGFFWGHVQFLDDPLEYTGTGGELFFGFLIVIAILFPVGFIYGIIGTVVPPDAEVIKIALEVLYYLVLFALLQIGFYRMWRYRMSRTTWRGVRFGLDGSSWAYLRLVALWTILSAVTFGIAYPWMKIDLWRYQVKHTRLGSETFRFDGDARSLLMPWLFVIVPVHIVMACWAVFLLSLDGDVVEAMRYAGPEQKHTIGILGIATVVAYAIAGIAFAYFRIRQARLQISGLRLGVAEFSSALPLMRLVGFALLGILLIAPFIGVPAAVIALAASAGGASPAVMAFMPLLILLALLVIWPVLWTTVFGFELAKQLVTTTHISNSKALEQASQSERETPSTGEGLADALDIGGF